MASLRTFSDLKARERQSRQNIIIDAAERVFASKPFDAVSMRDIAGEAGISHATIYRYFPDQQTLFMEAFLRGVEEVLPRIEEAARKNPDEPLGAASDAFISFLSEKTHYFKMMTYFMLDGELDPELLEKLHAAGRLVLDRFERLLKERGSVTEPRIFAHAFFASLNGILITFRDFPGRSGEEVLQHMKMLGRVVARVFEQAMERGGPAVVEGRE